MLVANDNDKMENQSSNYNQYESSIKERLDSELKMYDAFYEKIKHHANNHHQITLNSLHQTKENLDHLKDNAQALKEALFYHDETAIVDRQEIIHETEIKVHEQNKEIVHHDHTSMIQDLDSIDYLNKALIQIRSSFFENYQRSYVECLYEMDEFYDFFLDKSAHFQRILNDHEDEIMTLFLSLNEEIKEMDDSISQIIQKKNQIIQRNNQFFESEMKHFIDNQLMFSAVDDPTSIDLQALVSDKINQYQAYKKHLEEQEAKIEEILKKDYIRLFNQVYDRLLQQKGSVLNGDPHFFSHPEEALTKIKEDIIKAQTDKNQNEVKKLVSLYEKLSNYPKYTKELKIKAKSMVKRFEKQKKDYLLFYKLEVKTMITKLEEYLVLYQKLMDYDPFLAQTVGDASSKIIKEELNFLSLLQVNRELKSNINYDIETSKLKHRINLVENRLTYEVKKQLLVQDKELLKILTEVQIFLVSQKKKVSSVKQVIQKEKLQIDRLEKALTIHLEYQKDAQNINRKWISLVSSNVIKQIRLQETHEIHVREAESKIKRALKVYDITALHFKMMHENEMQFLISQSERVSQENEINNQFILTTFENQMRFAKEQIALAESEFRLRVESIQTIIDEEKTYLDDVVKIVHQKVSDQQKLLDDEYQAFLYKNNHYLTETTDSKITKLIQKEMDKQSKTYVEESAKLQKTLRNDPTLLTCKRKMEDLDEEFIRAFDEAEKLRDQTIQEMNLLYEEARSKHDALKPYLDTKVNILEPTFYQSLENINHRYKTKLKTAQVELDVASKDLVEDYIKIYYEKQPVIDQNILQTQMEEILTIREKSELDYAAKLKKIEDTYQVSLSALNDDMNYLERETRVLIENIKTKEEMVSRNISYEIQTLEKNHLLADQKRKQDNLNQIRILTEEYAESTLNNQKFRRNLSTQFERLLIQYQPYIRFSMKDKNVKVLFRKVHKAYRLIQRNNRKKIIQRMKKMRFDKE